MNFQASTRSMSELTQVLANVASGEPGAVEKLLPLVYDELRKLASVRMANEDSDHTLQSTALVHEVYLRLMVREERTQDFSLDATSGNPTAGGWSSRDHFFRAAALAMRHILIDQARRKAALKRGGSRRKLNLDDVASADSLEPNELLEINEALEIFAQQFPDHAKLVELRFFAGLKQREAAACLGISEQTARRQWLFARAWLFDRLAK